MRPKPDFQREHTLAREFYFMKKVGAKGLDWCYIGVGWRKVAQIG